MLGVTFKTNVSEGGKVREVSVPVLDTFSELMQASVEGYTPSVSYELKDRESGVVFKLHGRQNVYEGDYEDNIPFGNILRNFNYPEHDFLYFDESAEEISKNLKVVSAFFQYDYDFDEEEGELRVFLPGGVVSVPAKPAKAYVSEDFCGIELKDKTFLKDYFYFNFYVSVEDEEELEALKESPYAYHEEGNVVNYPIFVSKSVLLKKLLFSSSPVAGLALYLRFSALDMGENTAMKELYALVNEKKFQERICVTPYSTLAFYYVLKNLESLAFNLEEYKEFTEEEGIEEFDYTGPSWRQFKEVADKVYRKLPHSLSQRVFKSYFGKEGEVPDSLTLEKTIDGELAARIDGKVLLARKVPNFIAYIDFLKDVRKKVSREDVKEALGNLINEHEEYWIHRSLFKRKHERKKSYKKLKF